MDELDKIQKLAAMRDAGLVSAEEFENARLKLLASAVEGGQPKNAGSTGSAAELATAPPSSQPRHLSTPAPQTFSEAVKVCFSSKYSDFSCRASRFEYWNFVMFYGAVFTLLFVALSILKLGEFNSYLAIAVFHLVFALPALAVGARRLHDIGHSGWWNVGFVLTLGFAQYFSGMGYFRAAEIGLDRGRADAIGFTLNLVAFAIWVRLVIWLASSGQTHANKYGPALSNADRASVVTAYMAINTRPPSPKPGGGAPERSVTVGESPPVPQSTTSAESPPAPVKVRACPHCKGEMPWNATRCYHCMKKVS